MIESGWRSIIRHWRPGAAQRTWPGQIAERLFLGEFLSYDNPRDRDVFLMTNITDLAGGS